MPLGALHVSAGIAMNRTFACLLVLGTALAHVSRASGQDYSFRVPVAEMEVFVQPDASVRIKYAVTFRNNPGAPRIDVVDVGTPTAAYDLRNVRAACGDKPAARVAKSEYVKPGFEVHLGAGSIRPGEEGTFRAEFTMPDLVFQDTTREDYASLRITPTWFGEKYVTGTTDLKVAVHLPEGVTPDEALHQGLNFTQKAVFEGRTVVVWEWPATRFTRQHMVGVSFPKRGMERVVRVTRMGLLLKWFDESAGARVTAGLVFLALLGVLFFRFTGGTGIVVYVLLAVGAVVVFSISSGWHLASLPAVAVLIGVNEWALRRRSAGYMPPIAQVEGGGVKRGLTAPEAACLLELPLGRVLGLVVFGMLKKGLLHQLSADPLCVAVDEAFRPKGGNVPAVKDLDKFYRKAGQEKGAVVHKYEHAFLARLDEHPGKPVHEIDFRGPLRGLVRRVAERMQGFDLSDTQDYYRAIVRRAVEQAAAIGDVPQRQQQIDRDFEWILMDEGWPTVFGPHRPYRPPWTRPVVVVSGGGGGPVAAPSPGIPGRTTAGDVAASFAGWTENTFGRLASAISPGALALPGPSGGFIDLGGADRLTGEFFQALAESGGGGGGGGGGCACACAGCACACACAGGGR